jgi:hypothetical protein
MEHFDAALIGGLGRSAADLLVVADVVRDVAIQALILVLHGGSREQELSFATLFGSRTAILEVDGALETGDFPNGEFVFGRTILAQVRAYAFSLDDQRFCRKDVVFSTHGLG